MFTVRYGWCVRPEEITHRLIRNPNYGGKPTVVPGACIMPVVERKIKPKFFEALRDNVKLDGFRNPILVYQTPEGLLLSFGGSRLRVAKELMLPIPVIVVDYTGEWIDCEIVHEGNYSEFFRDPPELFRITDTGVDTHYSLERNRREFYDPAGMEWVKDHEGDKDFMEEEFPWL